MMCCVVLCALMKWIVVELLFKLFEIGLPMVYIGQGGERVYKTI